MQLPDIQRKLVEEQVGKFCDERFPSHVKSQLQVGYNIRGNTVTIIEKRISYKNPDEWIHIPIAQIRYNAKDSSWLLCCADRNGRWHDYEELKADKSLDRLLRELGDDPSGIFWG